jgi:hypothetical protein
MCVLIYANWFERFLLVADGALAATTAADAGPPTVPTPPWAHSPPRPPSPLAPRARVRRQRQLTHATRSRSCRCSSARRKLRLSTMLRPPTTAPPPTTHSTMPLLPMTFQCVFLPWRGRPHWRAQSRHLHYERAHGSNGVCAGVHARRAHRAQFAAVGRAAL